MECKNHNNKAGVNTCNVCGEWICEECSVESNGRIYCKNCFMEKSKTSETKSTYTKTVVKSPSSFLTFLCSFIPGCGQMYLGLMKRGLVILSSFFACMYLYQYSDALFYLGTLIWFFSFFDTFSNKSKIDSGISPKDDVDDLKKFIIDNKLIVIGFFIVVFAMRVLINLSYSLFNYDIKNLMVVLIIIAGIYLISKKNKHQ